MMLSFGEPECYFRVQICPYVNGAPATSKEACRYEMLKRAIEGRYRLKAHQ